MALSAIEGINYRSPNFIGHLADLPPNGSSRFIAVTDGLSA